MYHHLNGEGRFPGLLQGDQLRGGQWEDQDQGFQVGPDHRDGLHSGVDQGLNFQQL